MEKKLNRINADQLEGVELTDHEFQQVMAKVNQIDNSYEAAKILSAENSVGKLDGIYRDDNPKVTRKQITLTIFRKAEVRGGDSSYRIAREVRTSKNNRFDIVLLINGLPLINIEQKRVDKDLNEAYFQFKRYYRDGEYCTSFKTALFLSTRAGFDKVVFLVDRKELDSNTSKKFKEYSKYEPVDVNDTPYTYNLMKRLESKAGSIIVTTTHKLSALVKHYQDQKDYLVADKKIIFIIDEAHRTTMGEMMQNIKNYFKK